MIDFVSMQKAKSNIARLYCSVCPSSWYSKESQENSSKFVKRWIMNCDLGDFLKVVLVRDNQTSRI
jgi:hypothetical protein